MGHVASCDWLGSARLSLSRGSARLQSIWIVRSRSDGAKQIVPLLWGCLIWAAARESDGPGHEDLTVTAPVAGDG